MKKGVDYIGVGVGAVIINENNEILLLKRLVEPEQGCWTIPGGTVEFGETVEEAIIREMEEEIGVKIEVVKLLGVTNHILKDEKKHWVSPAFLVKIVKGVPENKEPHKHEDLKWFSTNSLPINPTMTTKVALNNYLNQFSKKHVN